MKASDTRLSSVGGRSAVPDGGGKENSNLYGLHDEINEFMLVHILAMILAPRIRVLAGVYKNGNVDIIANDQGNRITPSWVASTDTERLIGEAAKNQAASNSERIIFDVKRLIGRK
ncbi:Luminal-binding protein 2 [Acorus calamus]|uniref:Luminal-binding protein 2 n=1 Tax=Acorus calamus TaxID=4465 RepID=A0AAV9E7T1_ACOCL|nr:Luminal-binding protein 2 [Acorus calamus]